jgi:2-polyprenyl-6-methoxyphenol hydroxylase-like FAD-dependent oxidoreductase
MSTKRERVTAVTLGSAISRSIAGPERRALAGYTSNAFHLAGYRSVTMPGDFARGNRAGGHSMKYQRAGLTTDRRALRPTRVGHQAIVIGAGIAGMAAAGALADYFGQVTVLERDSLSNALAPRAGASQGWHSHGFLAGGLAALDVLFPGIDDDFVRAGAVPMRINQDLREEHANSGPMPQRDFGLGGYTMSRPLIESVLRSRLLQHINVKFQQNIRVLGIETDAHGGRITGVRWTTVEGCPATTMHADLVVDASGHGELTKELLQSIVGQKLLETAIGIDLCYTTAIMGIPDDAPTDWKVAVTHADAPRSSRRAVLIPIEGGRWMMTVVGRGVERPPAEWGALLDYLQQLPTRTIYNAVRQAKPVGRLARFLLKESVWRHFEHFESFPTGLLPIGDAICRFNPIYGQGMTVAAKEAVLLHDLLAARACQRDSLEGLGQEFLGDAKYLIETPWAMAAIPDFAFPNTRGDRPADLEQSLRFAAALSRIAARDEDLHRLTVEVWHMLRPRSAYRDPDLMRRIEAEMAEACVAI